MPAYFSHLVVRVRVQQGRLHVDGGSGGVKDHVVHVLLQHLGVSWILGPLNPPLTGPRQSGQPRKYSFVSKTPQIWPFLCFLCVLLVCVVLCWTDAGSFLTVWTTSREVWRMNRR